MNPYDVLGVDKDSLGDDEAANKEKIKIAYIKKSIEFHPDKEDGDSELFKEIKAAYDILKDPEARAYYDEHGIGKKKVNDRHRMVIGKILGNVQDWFSQENINLDMVGYVNKCLTDEMSQISREIQKAESCLKFTNQAVDMIKAEDDNFIVDFLNGKVGEIETFLSSADHNKSLIFEALELLENFTWEGLAQLEGSGGGDGFTITFGNIS